MISTIIPIYNTEKYIKRCLDSVISAKKKLTLEIILINDGSTDNSLKICDEYAKNYDFIKIFTQDNAGVSSARNKGITEAKGDFISFIDSDDWIEEEFFTKMFNVIKEGSIDLLVTNIQDFTKDGIYKNKKHEIQYLSSDKLFEPKRLFQKDIFLPTNSPSNKLYFRSIIINNNILFKEHLKNGEDFIFVLEYALCCKKIQFINDYSYNYNKLSETSVTSNYIKNYYSILKKTKDEFFSIIKKYQKIEEKEKIHHYFKVASKAIFEEGKITNGKSFKQRYYSIKGILNIEEIKVFRNEYKLLEESNERFFKFLRKLMKANQPLLITIFLTVFFNLKT